MASHERLPQVEPQEARRTAEEYLQQPGMQDPVAWALLAIAGELHLIRKEQQRQSRRSR